MKEIKGLVETAKTELYKNNWTPFDGGEWNSNMVMCKVIFRGPTRFCPATYTVFTKDGKYQGGLNGSKGSKTGKPNQIYTADQMSFFSPNWKQEVFNK